MSFFKFPRTPHLFVLPGLDIRNDKVLPESEAKKFFEYPVIIEEKVDGANVGISFDENNQLRLQNRGNYFKPGEQPQFDHIWEWVYLKSENLQNLLNKRYIVYGEWCYAEHSIHYSHLPEWFLGFDVYDTFAKTFFAESKRNQFLNEVNISPVPLIAYKKVTKNEITHIVEHETSKFGGGNIEGVYIRLESKNGLVARAKVVRKDFVQEMGAHWSKKRLVKNEIDPASGKY